MTASRTCRACGADLPGDVRWCLRCYAPVRELTPRDPHWGPGEFVDTPIVTNGAVPHWSRWEKSQTTFGPAGRIAITVFALMWLLGAVTQSPITTIFVLPLVTLLIRDVWRPGWVIPPDQAAKVPPAPLPPISAWLWDRSEFLRSLVLALVWIAGVTVLLNVQNPIPRFVVVATAVVAGAVWAWRKIGEGR